MSETEIILQCQDCSRFFVDRGADGRVLVSAPSSMADWFNGPGDPAAKFISCGWPDCEQIKKKNESCRDRRWSRRGSNRRSASRPALPAGRECRMPYKDDGERFESAEPGTVTAAELPQHEFESSGAADAQNKVLIEFFTDPKTHGRMFPMTYLEEISGAKRMNNRAIDLRRHFEPLGFGVWNEMKPFGPTGAMHSHYGLFPLAEVERKKKERDADRERKRAEREGQRTF